MSAADVLPPSPPTTSSRKYPYKLPSSLPTTSTPEDSPASGLEFSSLGSRKRVEFHPFTNVHHSSDPASSVLEPVEVKPLPPSRECQSSNRPILKVTVQNEHGGTGMDGPLDEKLSLTEAMESIIQQIASNDNAVMVDAYQTLAATIKAYDELPDEAVLKSKLSTITKHIRQHLGALDKSDSQPTDINLLTSALKVAVILVWSTDFSSLLNDDFRIFLTDRAIQILTEHTAPKSVVIHYLHLLATQDFRSGIITSNQRAARLIDALKGLTDHVKGNGVISERLLVFTKLLDQARSTMKAKASVWVEPMLVGMASSIPDTRGKALALGRKACQAFPPSNSIHRPVRFALDLKQESGKTLGAVICRKLEKMISNKDSDTALVPQIWAVVLLLANDASTPIDNWQKLREWLVVIQRCFNGSDTALRHQANLAWNRFVFIARPYEASEGLMSMLVKPIIPQLERQTDKSSKGSHALAVSGYCNLLYHAFRPATSHSQYTRAWNEYIVKVMRPSLFQKSPANADIASRILMALLWDAKTTTKVWNENRAHENRSVEPEELPTIDCKWIRSRCQDALDIFEVLFKYSSWGLPGSSDQAFVSKAWRHLTKGLKDAASKEIKTSNESRTAVTAIVQSLIRFGSSRHASRPGDDESPLLSGQTITILTRVAISELGITNILEVLARSLDVRHSSVVCSAFTMLQEESGCTTLCMGVSQSETINKCLRIMNKLMGLYFERHTQCGLAANHSLANDVCHILDRLPAHSISTCLDKLESGLSMWLRDEERSFSEPAQVDSFCKASIRALARVNPTEVAEVDGIFAAAFSSTHKTIVNAMAVLWNEKFGGFANLTVGPQLHGAISKLSPYVELDMPFNWETQWDNLESPELPNYETQERHAENTHARKQSEKNHDHTSRLVTQNARACATGDAQPQSVVPRRRKHDDSQIDFVPVESSPPAEMEESQYLTDRQKAVLERQRSEPAVVFPDLRSSPRPRSSRSQSRDCEFARKAASMTERPATPTLPDQNDDADPVPSPTPKFRVLRAVEDAEIPSSPPSIQGRHLESAVDEENMSSPPAEIEEPEEERVSFDSPEKETVPVTKLDAGERHTAPEYNSINVENELVISKERPPQGSESIAMESAQDDAQDDHEGPAELEVKDGTPSEKANALRIRVPSSQINTDELNEMSTTQLSNDLEWSQVFDAVDQEAPDVRMGDAEATLPAQQEMQEHKPNSPASAAPSQSSLNLRKRKRAVSGYADKDGRHRRRRTASRSQSLAGQEFAPKPVVDEETYDEITVWSSSPARPRASNQSLENVIDAKSPVKKEVRSETAVVEIPVHRSPRRGRSSNQRSNRRSSQRQQSRLESQRFSLPRSLGPETVADATIVIDDVARPTETSPLPGTTQVEPPTQQRALEDEMQRNKHGQAEGGEWLTKERQMPQTASVPVSPREKDAAVQMPAMKELDLMASLQYTLELAKSVPKGSFDLRAVADWCFQIQHEATLTAAREG